MSKGSHRRPYNREAYDSNYDRIYRPGPPEHSISESDGNTNPSVEEPITPPTGQSDPPRVEPN